MKMVVRNLCCGYDRRQVLFNVNASFNTGEVVCLLGPNGSGKTTLFKSILGLHRSTGDIFLDSRPLLSIPQNERARILSYVPQVHIPPFPFKVIDVVLTGRTSYIGAFSLPSESDIRESFRVLDLLHIAHLYDRNYAQLSGGERQLVLIARALAQSPDFIVMDEPTSHLDYGNQLRTISTIQQLSRRKMGIILTTHVPDHCFMCATKVIALCKGRVIADGAPEEVLTKSILSKMYGVDVDIVSISQGKCICTPSTEGVL